MLRASVDSEDQGASGGHWERVRWQGFAYRYAILLFWVAIIGVFGALEPSTFLTAVNFEVMFGSQAVLVVLTLALLFPLTAGDYDLSVASNLTLSAMIVAVLNVNHHMPIGPVIVIALAVGALIGVINGGLIVIFGMDPFIVTLGTGTVIGGVIYLVSDSSTIGGISPGLVNWVFLNRFFGVPLAFYYGLALVFVVWYVLGYTTLGRRLLYVGRGRSVSLLSGLNVGRLRWGAMIASGFIAAFAGVLYAGTQGAADPNSGQSFLLPAFAAAFLGSTSIIPGRFNAWGSFVSVYFLVTGITGLQLLGAKSFVQEFFYGGALIIAVLISQFSKRREIRESGSVG